MEKLETLLNSLVDMGLLIEGGLRCLGVNGNNVYFYNPEVGKTKKIAKSLRWLVSLESGLWQFVCENRVVKENDDVRIKNYQGDNECDTNCCYDDYEYRLLEAALIPEEELGNFLLDNIKVEGLKSEQSKR